MRELITGLDQAVYDTIHEYVDPRSKARGAVALAPRVGMQPGTLSNKANPLQETSQLTLAEAVTIQTVTQDFRILQAFAASLDHCAHRLPAEPAAGDVALLDSYTELHAALGRKAVALKRVLADGRVSPAELREMRQLLDEAIRAGLQLLSRLEGLAG